MRRLAAAAACLLLLSGAAHAAEWVADPAASKLGFSGVQVGQPFSGHFQTFTARISFDPAHPQAGTADVTVDLASAATGDTQRDTALPQADWFDVAHTGKAMFHASSFVPKGGDSYDAVGTLTLRGISAPVTVPFTLAITGDTAHATGHADLLRSTFGVGQGAWASDEYVAFKVGVDIDLVARKAP